MNSKADGNLFDARMSATDLDTCHLMDESSSRRNLSGADELQKVLSTLFRIEVSDGLDMALGARGNQLGSSRSGKQPAIPARRGTEDRLQAQPHLTATALKSRTLNLRKAADHVQSQF